MADIAKLREELATDPLQLGYAQVDDQAAMELLNAKTRTRLVALSSQTLLAWCANDGRLARIKAGFESGRTDAEKSLCEASFLLISRDDAEFDLNLPDRVTMLDALLAFGRITADERQEIYDLATEDISRSEEIGIGQVRLGDIEQAR
jgi:hypothetical protein